MKPSMSPEKATEIRSASEELRSIEKYEIRRTAAPIPKVAIHSGSAYARIVHALVCSSWLVYYGLRLYDSTRADADLRSRGKWVAWLFLACEAIMAGPELFQIIELSLSIVPGSRGAPRAQYRLEGTDAPLVHVFITTCGERPPIVMSTLAGAVAQDYPAKSFRVFVLDDANDPKLKVEVDNFNRSISNKLSAQSVVYLARKKDSAVRHYYKAGNLDFGIRTSKDDYGGSEYIAGLDVDMIVESDWLSRVVPHLILSADLAVVSPPQSFYNVPDNDILAQDASVLQQVLEPARDRIGCSMCHGSGYVMRRAALESIGGWPLVNIGEDILCSYLLNQAGWQTAFIEDELQFGVTCESFHAYVSQRMRWTAGNLLSAHRFRLFLPILTRSKITVVQRFHGSMQSVKTYAWIALIVPMVALPLGLPFARPRLVPGSNMSHDMLRVLRSSYLVMWLTTKAWKRLNFGHVGLRNLFNLSNNRLWITPYIVCAYYQSLWCNLEEIDFTISGTFQSPLNERSEEKRRSLWKRMSDPLIMLHTLYWLFAAVALITQLLAIAYPAAYGQSQNSYCLTGLTIRLFEIVVATWVPIQYMMSPPSIVAQEQRVVKDATGADRAVTKTWTKRESNQMLWKDLFELLIIIKCDWA